MSSPEIPPMQQTTPTSSTESQSTSRTMVISKATGAEAHSGDISLDQVDYADRTASVLQNTYLFKKEEARQVSAFAEAIKNADPNLYVDVKSGFLDKIKALCAKILKFFGNDSKSVQLHGDGIAVFDEIKTRLLLPENRNFALQFIKANEIHADVVKGFARILGLKLNENLNLNTQLETFINTKYFNNLEIYVGKNGKIADIRISCHFSNFSGSPKTVARS